MSKSFINHANKIIGCLCLLTVCAVYWLYYAVSDELPNRHSYITNSHRWNELMNGSHEHIWPREFDETNDRIQSQLKFTEYYGSLPANRTVKYILRVGFFNFENVREGQFHFDNCPVHECSLTFNDALSHSVDALLISEMSFFNWLNYFPKPKHQLWIAQHWESAMHDRIDTLLVRRHINWTVSYRRDSTLGITYGKYARTSTTKANSSHAKIDYSVGKSKQVAWLVSNCNAKNNRLQYAHELAKYIDVDIYGTCGRLKCNRTGPDSCHYRLVKHYRFFLAFENSNCKDYITEKLYHVALQHNVIPIVMGARSEDYAALAPPGSYIDVRSFSGPQELAQYLKVLAADPKLYNKYFEWKETWSQIDVKYWCRLCMMLHLQDDIGYITWFENYHMWWNSVCGNSSLYSCRTALRNAVTTCFVINLLLLAANVIE